MGKAKGVQFLVWDVGGQEKLRPLWRSYTRFVHFILIEIARIKTFMFILNALQMYRWHRFCGGFSRCRAYGRSQNGVDANGQMFRKSCKAYSFVKIWLFFYFLSEVPEQRLYVLEIHLKIDINTNDIETN